MTRAILAACAACQVHLLDGLACFCCHPSITYVLQSQQVRIRHKVHQAGLIYWALGLSNAHLSYLCQTTPVFCLLGGRPWGRQVRRSAHLMSQQTGRQKS